MTINQVLPFLEEYPVDHHSREIKDIIPEWIKEDLPAIPKYLKSRFIQTEMLKQIEKGALKEDPESVFVSKLWIRNKEID